MNLIDHFSIGVADLARSARLYDALFAVLDGARLVDAPDFVAYGSDPHQAKFILVPLDKADLKHRSKNGFHVCFRAADRAMVEAFHATGLEHGATDNGPPGYRTQYAPDYYGAFLIDPDGNHLGVVARVAPDA